MTIKAKLVKLLHLSLAAAATTIQCSAFSPIPSVPRSSRLYLSTKGPNIKAIEALRILNDFHEGIWKGKATSFTITSDLASGVVQRKVLQSYKTSVKVGLDANSKGTAYILTENFEWDIDKISARTLNLVDSDTDVDSVDASYSLNTATPNLPADLIGTENMLRFCVEHTIAINDNERIRCFILYGVDQTLARVVVCEEKRVEEPKKLRGRTPLTPVEDILTIKSDTLKIAEKVAGNILPSSLSSISTTPPEPPIESEAALLNLTRHSTDLSELICGVWLGDAIMRNPNSYEPTKGFKDGKKASKLVLRKKAFADWTMGVQKLACRWNWSLDDTFQKIVNLGKPLGVGLDKVLTTSISGVVCVNESLVERIPKDERMVFVDLSSCDSVWFLLNHVSIQAPKCISLEVPGKQSKSFWTEMTVFQRSAGAEMRPGFTPEGLCASTIARVYDADGRFKQGSTSFFTFKQMR